MSSCIRTVQKKNKKKNKTVITTHQKQHEYFLSLIAPNLHGSYIYNTMNIKKRNLKLTNMKQPFTASSSSSSLIRKARLSPYLFTLLAFIVFVAILYGEDFVCLLGQLDPNVDRLATITGELSPSVDIKF